MERIISDEERIRKAIEISQRRNNTYYKNETTRVNLNDKKEYKLFKKMILQIIICLLIYIIFHLVSTTNYAFSEEMLRNTNNILNYDINLENLYKECQKFLITTFNNNEDDESAPVNTAITNNRVNEITNIVLEKGPSINEDTNSIVIENEESNKADDKKEEKNTQKTAMELDAEKAKKLCKFKAPLSGTITSEFGQREATIDGMTTDHKGIDIAAKSGTNIKAAIAGTVSVAEENSEYGKFIKIVDGDVMTVYAHCKTLKVKVGDKIKLGQTIATVGSTGNSTGPHLHFEIRLENRYINPRYVIEF